jgi:predicted DNA-binding protein
MLVKTKTSQTTNSKTMTRIINEMYKQLNELKVDTNKKVTDLKENSNKHLNEMKKTMQYERRIQ